MNVTQFRGSALGGLLDTGRSPSPSIWSDCPVLEIISGSADGIFYHDDFENGPRVAAGAEAVAGRYRGFADTGGSVVDGGEIGGTLLLSSDGDNEGASFRTSTAAFQIARNLGKLWFECRVKSSDITDNKHGIFVGFMADNVLSATIPITATGTIADVNIVGFHRLESDGDQFDTIFKADGQAQQTVQIDAASIAADTYVKLGMVFDPKTNQLSFYRNGVRLANAYSVVAGLGTEFPNDVRLGLVIAILNATATAPGNCEIDWWRAAQLAA
jgi:hypothetical protein